MVVWGDIILGFKKFVGVKVLYGFVCLFFFVCVWFNYISIIVNFCVVYVVW